MAYVKDYIKIRDLVHLAKQVSEYVGETNCGINTGTELHSRIVHVNQFDPCELCCECQAYEEAAQKVSQ